MTLHGGRYLLLQTIGRGGMGAVYLARDTQRSNDLVAIKEMGQARLKDAGELQRAQQRFQREASLLQQLRHPRLPQVYASFQDRNRSYLVMDYIRGQTLAQALKKARGSALPVEQVLDYALQLCDVLSYLHRRVPPVIFRDLKPSNIMLRDDGQVFLIDFGIARTLQQAPDTETFVTPGYAPPEQYGGQTSERSDIFSLGATLHYCLTGHNPQANTQAHQCDFQPIDFFNPQVPDALCTLVAQMVEVRPEERPASIEEVRRRLDGIRMTWAGAVRLAGEDIYDPGAITYRTGNAPQTVYATRQGTVGSSRSPRPRLRVLLGGLSIVGGGLFGGFAGALQGVSIASIGSSVRALPARWWQDMGRAVDNWSWDPRVWTPRFIGVSLTVLTLMLSGSLYLVRSAPDAPHLTALALLFGLLCLLVVNLSDERLDDSVLRSIFGLMILSLLLAGLALQALPDMVALEQRYLALIPLSKVGALLLLLGSVICLLRPANRFAWADQLQLSFLAGSCALLHIGFGAEEARQLPFLNASILALLIVVLLGSALLALFRYSRPLGRWSRITLLLVALAFAPLQYLFGYNELQQLLAGSAPSNDLLQHLAQANVFCVFVPLLCTLLACFGRQAHFTPPTPSYSYTSYTYPPPYSSSPIPPPPPNAPPPPPPPSARNQGRPGLLTRLALFSLTLTVAALFSQLGQRVALPFFSNNPFPLNTTMLSFTTLYQLIEPLFMLLTFIALLRVRQRAAFRWLDHTVALGLALFCALLNSAYWQTQATAQIATMNQSVANQQFTLFAAQLPAFLIYGILLALVLGLLVLAFGAFRQQAAPSARLDAWLKWVRALLTRLERLLILAMIAIALLLQGFFGPLQSVLIYWSRTQQYTGRPQENLAVLTIAVLLPLIPFACVLLVRLLAPSRPTLGGADRWATWLAALACLLLTWQDPRVARLPLLQTGIQLTGNPWNTAALLLGLLLVGGLLLAILLARFWLRRGFFTRYRALMQPLLVLALLCFLLQFLWPLLLPLGLMLLIITVLLAGQIEKVI